MRAAGTSRGATSSSRRRGSGELRAVRCEDVEKHAAVGPERSLASQCRMANAHLAFIPQELAALCEHPTIPVR